MQKVIDGMYVYCTDFIINLANLLSWSYYEVNTLLFCVGYPLLLVGVTGLYFWQWARWKRLSSEV